MARQYKVANLAVGDKIAYSVQFLKSIGMSHGEMARARGTVNGFMYLSDTCKLAEIVWDRGQELPDKVNVSNLAKVGPNPRFCNVD